MLANRFAREIYEFGSFRLDPAEGLLRRDGQPLALEPKVFQTLLVLVRNRGRLVEKDELMREVWPDRFFEETNLARNVSVLRRTLGKDENGNQFIETAPRRGYRFVGRLRPAEHRIHDNGNLALFPDPEAGSAEPGLPLSAGLRGLSQAYASAERFDVSVRQGAAQLLARGRRLSFRWRFAAGILLLGILVTAIAAAIYLRQPGANNAAAPPGARSIAVLPFISPDAEGKDNYLGWGLADSMISRLGYDGRVSVRPASAVKKYEAEGRDPSRIGRDLNVDAVLDGRFQRSGDQIRLTAQLINVKDGAILWTRQFDEGLNDLQTIQDSMAVQILQAMRLPPIDQERKEQAKRASNNGEAYQAYLKGRYYWNRRNTEDIFNAEAEFQRAIKLDPNYAAAYAGLADCYLTGGTIPSGKPPDMALKALELDDTLAEAHASLAYRKSAEDWDWTGAETEFQRALALNPSYATAHHWYAYHLASMGRLGEALSEMLKAQQLDPLSLIINTDVGHILYLSRRYDEAISRYLSVIEIDPSFIVARWRLAEAYSQNHMHKEAVAEFKKAIGMDAGKYPSNAATLGYAYAIAGEKNEALRIVAALEPVAETRHYASAMAVIYSGLDWKDLAFIWLQKGLRDHSGSMALLQVEPMFDNLRSDPRYAELLRQMNLGV
jgi:DNA-binding winged helix-turn-helix (wHTH) protein/TolB-like protein/Tfp pilus assembly protein PilF